MDADQFYKECHHVQPIRGEWHWLDQIWFICWPHKHITPKDTYMEQNRRKKHTHTQFPVSSLVIHLTLPVVFFFLAQQSCIGSSGLLDVGMEAQCDSHETVPVIAAVAARWRRWLSPGLAHSRMLSLSLSNTHTHTLTEWQLCSVSSPERKLVQ